LLESEVPALLLFQPSSLPNLDKSGWERDNARRIFIRRQEDDDDEFRLLAGVPFSVATAAAAAVAGAAPLPKLLFRG
jgi:hypothetical protein